MSTTFRQDLSRFEEIEIGDTLTYHVDQIIRVEEKFERYTPEPKAPPYGRYVARELLLNRAGGYHITGKVIEKSENGWLIKKSGSKKKDPFVEVTLENFWALRKAPGKAIEKRFDAQDAVVSCQVCGGAWIGNTGKTPHHGYTRPGWGVQSPSCTGALELPYAVIQGFGQKNQDPNNYVKTIGRNILTDVIQTYEDAIQNRKNYLEMLRRTGPESFPGIDDGKPYRYGEKQDSERRQPLLRGTKGYSYGDDYEKRLTYEIKNTELEIQGLEREANHMRQRYEDWLPGGKGVMTAPV